MLSAISQYIGAAIAVSVFDEVEPQTVAWFRVMGATVALLAISPGFHRGWTRRQLFGAAVFGTATALMNLFFYMAIDRIDLGKSVAIEFIGPIAVAAAMTRSTRNAVALVLAVAGVMTLGGVELADNAVGRDVHPDRVGDVGDLHRGRFAGRPVRARRGRARRRAGVRLVGADRPSGAPCSGAGVDLADVVAAVLRHRRVLERDRIRHRPVRAAPDPGAALLGVAGAAARSRRWRSVGSPSTSNRARST